MRVITYQRFCRLNVLLLLVLLTLLIPRQVRAINIGDALIVDDLSPGFEHKKGKNVPGHWDDIPCGLGDCWLDHAFWTYNRSAFDGPDLNVPVDIGVWTPAITDAGYYEVFVFIPEIYAETSGAKYQVHHSGVVDSILIDQFQSAGWISLGGHYFQGTGAEHLYLDDVVPEQGEGQVAIAFDAAKFVYWGSTPPPPPDRTPPVIDNVHYWSNGQGGANFRAHVTDNVGVTKVILKINGLSITMTHIGGDIYEANAPVPIGQVHTFAIEAYDAANNRARYPNSRSIRMSSYASKNLGLYGCKDESSRGQMCSEGPGPLGTESDPVITEPETGNFADVDEYLVVEGVGDADIEIYRGYNSLVNEPQGIVEVTLEGEEIEKTALSAHPELFGRGSSFLLSVLAIDNALFSGVEVRYEDGHIVHFARQPNGSLAPVEPRVYDTLRVDGGGYVLERKDLTIYRFNAAGQLVESADKNGNTVTYTWVGKQLTQAKNSAGRQVSFSTSSQGLIEDVYAPEGVHLHFGYENGRLTSFTDGEEHTWRYTYTAEGRLETITKPDLTPAMALGYDEVGRVITQTLGIGRRFFFAYDPGAHTTVITDPDGKQTTHGYNTSAQLTTNSNAVGTEEYAYANGHRTQLKDREGRDWQFIYNARGNIIHEQGPLGWQRRWAYNALDLTTAFTDTLNRVWHMDYDPRGNLKSITNPLTRTSTIAYDGRGLPTVITDYNTNPVTNTYHASTGDLLEFTNANGDRMFYGYDGLGRVKTVTDFNGNSYSFTYDGNSNITLVEGPLDYRLERRYDESGRLKDIIDANNVVTHIEYNDIDKPTAQIQNYRPEQQANHETNLTSRYFYSEAGDVISQTNPLGDAQTFIYDDAHRIVGIRDAQGNTTSYELDNVDNVLAIVDADEHRTDMTYDALDRLTSTTDDEGHVERYIHDLAGNLRFIENSRVYTTEIRYDPLDRPVLIIDARGKTESIEYDHMGNVTARTDRNGHTERFTFDRTGALVTHTDAETKTTTLKRDKNGNVVEVVDANGNPTTFGINALNQVDRITNAEHETTRFVHDALGNLLQEIAPDSIVKRNVYDPIYRLTQVTLNHRPGLPASADTNVSYRYTWDANSNLKAIADPLLHITRFEHNILNQLTSETDPEENTWKYTYTRVGLLKTRLDANQNLTSYSYYDDNTLKRVDYADGTFVEYERDPNHNVTSMTDHLGASSWRYDELDRPTEATDALGRRVAYRYDAEGQIIGMTYPDERELTKSYYRNGWLKSMTDPSGGTTSYQRDAVGLPTRITNPNSTVAELAYDRANRPLKVVNRQVGGANKTISAYEYTLNDLGQKIKTVQQYGWRQPTIVTESYSYDALRRVSGVQSSEGYQASYQFDAASNRTQLQSNDDLGTNTPRDAYTSKYSYNKANQLQQVLTTLAKTKKSTTTTFTWDDNGNLLNKQWNGPQGPAIQGTDYRYDMENMLVEALNYQHGSGKRVDRAVTRFFHDGNGRRLAKEHDPKLGDEGVKRTEYAFMGLDPIAEYDLWNGHQRNFYRGDQGRITSMQRFPSAEGAGNTYWYHYDGLGSVTGITKQHGQSTHSYRYDIYGAVYPDAGNFTDPHNHYTFTGQEYDEETGLLHFHARDYDPHISGWLNADPYRGQIHVPLSIHRYIYVGQNPINYIDKYGYFGFALPIITTIAGAAIGAAISYGSQVANNIKENGLSGEAFTNVETDSIIKGAIIGATVGLAVGSAGLIAPSAIAWASGVGVNAQLIAASAGLSYQSTVLIGGATQVVAASGIIAGTGLTVGGFSCSINPYFSENTRNSCVGLTGVGASLTTGTYSYGETIRSIGGWNQTTFRGQTVYQRGDIDWDSPQPSAGGLTNRQLIQNGRSPIGRDGRPIVLHHLDQKPNGPLVEMETRFHQKNYCSLHSNTGQSKSLINRSEFNRLRGEYWESRP